MIISPISAMIYPEKVYLIDSKRMCVIDKPLFHELVGIYAIQVRFVKNWEVTDETHVFSKDNFLEGSGYGGSPYIIPDFCYKVKNNAIYRDIE